jgi:hypothetical protein
VKRATAAPKGHPSPSPWQRPGSPKAQRAPSVPRSASQSRKQLPEFLKIIDVETSRADLTAEVLRQFLAGVSCCGQVKHWKWGEDEFGQSMSVVCVAIHDLPAITVEQHIYRHLISGLVNYTIVRGLATSPNPQSEIRNPQSKGPQ